MRAPSLHPYAAAVLATARRRALFARSDRVLVALSAGPDSTALLAALAALRDAGELAGLDRAPRGPRAARRGEADAACAAAACARLGVPLRRVAVEVAAGNVQAEARRARYAALRAEAARAGATRIATGHTRTDQAETLLLRLLRGAGARGLAGIPPRRGAVIRPLIDRARDEGLAYLAELGLAWRDDPTNATPRFARNRVRNEAWPALRALAPAAERALARAADLLRDDDRALDGRARRRVREGTGIEVAALRREPLAVRRRMVRRLWRNATGSGRALEAGHVEAVLALLERARPGAAALPGGMVARCRYGAARGPPPVRARAGGQGGAGGRTGSLRRPGAGAPRGGPGRAARRRAVAGRAAGPGDREIASGRRARPGPPRSRSGSSIARSAARSAAGSCCSPPPKEPCSAIPALRVVAQGLGPSGAALEVLISSSGSGASSYCNGGAGLL